MFSDSPGMVIAVSVVISITIFLICRELFCWYFKINKRTELLTKILEQQTKLVELATPVDMTRPRKDKDGNYLSIFDEENLTK